MGSRSGLTRHVPLARSFGRAVHDYERGRPDWPDEAVERIGSEIGADADVIDLAAGTGKLTRTLASRFARVVAVEPDDAMRAVLAESLPDVRVVAGTAESIPLGDASADAVFAADAFHWFDGDAALRELARVLRARGVLALLWNEWNEFDPPIPDDVRRTLRAVYDRAGRPGGPRYASGEWRAPFGDSPFEPLREERFTRTVTLDREQTVSLWLSVSSVASLPHDERSELAEYLRARLADSYRLPVRTDLHWTRRTA